MTGAGQVRMQPVVPCTGREGRCISTPVTSSRHSGEERIKRMLFFWFCFGFACGFFVTFQINYAIFVQGIRLVGFIF